MKNPSDIRSFIGSYFIYQHIYPCVKLIFNAWYSCKNCTNLWMNELHTIFIINSSHAKFVRCYLCDCLYKCVYNVRFFYILPHLFDSEVDGNNYLLGSLWPCLVRFFESPKTLRYVDSHQHGQMQVTLWKNGVICN
jgi:hypothetical protein